MVDVVSDQTELSYAETTTGWSGDSFVQDTEIKVQGNAANSCIQTANGVNDVIFTGGAWNMAGKTLRMYAAINYAANFALTNAIQLFASDGTNTAYWTVANAAADYKGGWQDFFLDVDSTPTSGTVNTAAVTSVGIRVNTATKPRNALNAWYDNWRFGNGLEINSTTTEAINFTDVAAEDALVTNKYDILELTDGVIFGKGKLTLGNAAAAKNCNLVSLNETIYFLDRVISTALYALVATQGTGNTDIDINGLTCKTVGTSGAELDFSLQVRNLSIVGSSFSQMGLMEFVLASVTTLISANKFTSCGITNIGNGLTIEGSTWSSSDQIQLNTSGILSGAIVDSCTAASSVLATTLDNISGNFTSDGSNHAVEITSIGGGSMSWNPITSNYDAGVAASPVTPTATGNEDIYVNVASGTLTINVAAGATTPSIRSAGAVVNVVAGLVALTIEANVSLVGAEVAIYDMDTTPPDFGTELAHVESHVSATYVYSGSGLNTIKVQVMLAGYKEYLKTIIMPTADGTLSITLETETND